MDFLSKWYDRKNIIWTVEWIKADKSRSLCDSSGLDSLQQAYDNNVRFSKKRKRPTPNESSNSQSQPVKRSQHVSTPHADQNERIRPNADGEKEVVLSSGRGDPTDINATNNRSLERPITVSELAEDAYSSPNIDGPDSESVPTQHHFFLLKPRTSSSRHVLIPVPATTSISDSLRGRTVLEFPTFYVFTGVSPQLPDEFMLEEDYVRQEQEEQREFDDMMRKVNPSALRAIRGQPPRETSDEEVDSARILDVLKRDLGTSL